MKSSVTISGTRELQRRLKAIADTRGLLRDVQLATIREAKRRVPRKTGHLGRTIGPGQLTKTYATVEVTAPYASEVELGTKPHIIRPKTKRVLAWPATAADRRLSGRARVGGRMRFAAFVRHPGTKAQPYLLPAARHAFGTLGVRRLVEKWNRAA